MLSSPREWHGLSHGICLLRFSRDSPVNLGGICWGFPSIGPSPLVDNASCAVRTGWNCGGRVSQVSRDGSEHYMPTFGKGRSGLSLRLARNFRFVHQLVTSFSKAVRPAGPFPASVRTLTCQIQRLRKQQNCNASERRRKPCDEAVLWIGQGDEGTGFPPRKTVSCGQGARQLRATSVGTGDETETCPGCTHQKERSPSPRVIPRACRYPWCVSLGRQGWRRPERHFYDRETTGQERQTRRASSILRRLCSSS